MDQPETEASRRKDDQQAEGSADPGALSVVRPVRFGEDIRTWTYISDLLP